MSGGGKPLPDAVRGQMEAALGADFSAVRVHVGPQAERIGAVAFTTGNDLYFAPGRYQPDTIQGKQLLGHELAHVVQQRQGRVRNPVGAGVAVVQDRALEAEADRLGMRAATTSLIAQRVPTDLHTVKASPATSLLQPKRGRPIDQPNRYRSQKIIFDRRARREAAGHALAQEAVGTPLKDCKNGLADLYVPAVATTPPPTTATPSTKG